MSPKLGTSRLRTLLRRGLAPILGALDRRVERVRSNETGLLVAAAARGLAASGDWWVLPPTLESEPRRTARMGFVGNIANNAYNFVRCLRRLGLEAELVVEDGGFDTFLMNRPAWEDVDLECGSLEEGAAVEATWKQPAWVRRVSFDPELQMRYQGRLSAADEVRELYRAAFGRDLGADRALALAQFMGHWPLLLAMRRYDTVQLSGAAISLGPFSPRPVVVFPTGSDLFLSPFEEDLFGMLMRAGFRSARSLLLCETNYARYLDRLQTSGRRAFAPMMVDTDTYTPGSAEELRHRWGGRGRFAVQVCRQDWHWKGNDRLLRGFARALRHGLRDWKLVLLGWGADLERSRELVRSLGIESEVVFEPLCSKPRLRLRQRAADLVVDQMVIEGYGTSVLESMAAARPVMMRPVPPAAEPWFPEPPPFLAASDEEEVFRWFVRPDLDRVLAEVGPRSRKWVETVHAYRAVAPTYLAGHRHAAGRDEAAAG